MNLFVCGPLFFPEVWRIVAGRSFVAINALLKGYACLNIRGHKNPGLFVLTSAVCDGFLYRNIDSETMTSVDNFYGEMHQRQNVKVIIEDGDTLMAVAHVIKFSYLGMVKKQPWNAEQFRQNQMKKFLEALAH